MAHCVKVSDFDAFDIGEPAPAASPSPPSVPFPVPQPGTSQTQPKKQEGYCCIWQPAADGSLRGRTGRGRGCDGGDEGAGAHAGAKKKKLTKELRTGIY